MNHVSDGRISEMIANKLAACGLSTCRISVRSSNGQVTLSGTVEHAHQMSLAASAARGITGVERVVNQIHLKPAVMR